MRLHNQSIIIVSGYGQQQSQQQTQQGYSTQPGYATQQGYSSYGNGSNTYNWNQQYYQNYGGWGQQQVVSFTIKFLLLLLSFKTVYLSFLPVLIMLTLRVFREQLLLLVLWLVVPLPLVHLLLLREQVHMIHTTNGINFHSMGIQLAQGQLQLVLQGLHLTVVNKRIVFFFCFLFVRSFCTC